MKYDNFFMSDEWLNVLKIGLGAHIYYSDTKDYPSYAFPIFSKGPFGVAYPGFPVGGALPNYIDGIKTDDWLKGKIKTSSWHMIRIWNSKLEPSLGQTSKPSSYIQETYLPSIKRFSMESLHSPVRRDIKRAIRRGVRIENAQISDAKKIYQLYIATIKRNHGSLRYTFEYFRQLTILAQKNYNLNILVAINDADEVIGFAVWIKHLGNGYYLHGASDRKYSKDQPSELLIYKAISQASESFVKGFSFMGSPRNQPGLIRFKEKWGGETCETPVFDCYIPTIRGFLLRTILNYRAEE